ncbi:MAG: hypothetical protein ACUVV5_09000 [Candidatus Aminicenantales bacterium]
MRKQPLRTKSPVSRVFEKPLPVRNGIRFRSLGHCLGIGTASTVKNEQERLGFCG